MCKELHAVNRYIKVEFNVWYFQWYVFRTMKTLTMVFYELGIIYPLIFLRHWLTLSLFEPVISVGCATKAHFAKMLVY